MSVFGSYLEALNQYYYIRVKQPDRPSFKNFHNVSVLSAEREQRANDHGREALVRENA